MTRDEQIETAARKVVDAYRIDVRAAGPWSVQLLDAVSELWALLATPATDEAAELRRRLDEARAEYRKAWDCEDDESIASLMRTAVEEAQHQRERFKARGGELDAMEARLAEVTRALRKAVVDLAAATQAFALSTALPQVRSTPGGQYIRAVLDATDALRVAALSSSAAPRPHASGHASTESAAAAAGDAPGGTP